MILDVHVYVQIPGCKLNQVSEIKLQIGLALVVELWYMRRESLPGLAL